VPPHFPGTPGDTSAPCGQRCDGPTLEPDGYPSEDVRWHLPPALAGVEVLSARYSRRLWRVFHENYSVCIVPAGANDARCASEWLYRRRIHTFRPGMVAMIEPGQVHATKRMTRPADYFWVLELPPPLLVSAASELGIAGPPHFDVAQSTDTTISTAFERLDAAIQEGASVLEQQSRLAGCVRLLLGGCGERRPTAPAAAAAAQLARVREYLHAHFTEDIRLQDLAKVSGLSRFHVAHAFSRVHGVPPHAYQTLLRVAAARDLLRGGVRPADIDLGFADQSHLTRHFKQILGITPAAYARAMRRGSGARGPEGREGVRP
jgi:AraC-like DNA-binding protein